MEEPSIKLYPIDSELSKIPDLILDEESKFLLFETRDFTLSNNKEYSISIQRKDEFKIENAKILDFKCNKFKVDAQDPLTKNAKTPFKVILKNSSEMIASGLFYRYRTDPKKSPSKWDEKFSPERHKNYKERGTFNNTIEPKNQIPKSTKNNTGLKKENTSPASELISVSDDDTTDKKLNNPIFKNSFIRSDNLESKSKSLNTSKKRIKEEPISPVSEFKDSFTEPMIIDIKDSDYNFHSFLLNIRYDSNSISYNTDITEKLNITNRAIRILKENYNVKKIAHFKINFRVENTVKNSELEKFLVKILTNGICVELDGKKENFFCYIGSSNSGRKERNFWAIDKESCDKLNFNHFLNFFGNFSQFSQIYKLNKRYSLLYSSSVPVFRLKRTEYKIVEDFENNDYCFTDGVGIIRQETCEEISKNLNLDYTSYIFQIRIGGFKGVLTGFSDNIFNKICPGVNKKVKILFRKSQEKFESNDFYLNIVSWAPNVSVPANLNSEILMILDGLCSEKFKEYILRIFQDYLDEIEKSLTDPKKALAKLFNSDVVDEFTHKYKMILLACRQNLVQELDPRQYKIIRELIIEQGLYNIITKRAFNIQIEKSRYFIGVIDETDVLKEDEIYVSYRNSLGNIEYLDGSFVLVCRVPCYSVTEARRVRTKYVDELSHLVNCVVFPKKGSRPLTDILSGGDLDGDLYFVSWDDHLTDFDNSKTELKYPTNPSSSGKIDEKNLLNQLAEVYASDVLYENKTGLWHYFLLCSYDQDRKNMLKNLSESKIEEENLKEIVKKIENGNQIQKDKCDLFKGMYERQESKNYCSEKDKQKAEFANEFRDFVVNLKYFREEINDKNMKKSVYSFNGLYFRSRVVNLYKTFKNEEKFKYQIPWMFYDVLCLMKNFCNDNLSPKVSQVFPTMIPFSMSADSTNIFSTKKLSNFN
ncbi:putative RNA-dependent RNA polymerase 1 [Brachionus plicatilis]|uniref:RNA-dependent RNA polymerase n=1 Tax=Brachionus plicatilis TaxID=10195 RepID=A0A3M7PEI8_BRAPC|nr:putative RNA-dependent RNA polymerase 1 [Brachionus plicatilis]